jgi:hypothetical protein
MIWYLIILSLNSYSIVKVPQSSLELCQRNVSYVEAQIGGTERHAFCVQGLPESSAEDRYTK